MRRIEELARMVSERKMAPPADPEVEQAAPFLWEMLTLDAWGDGTERLLPQIVIERVPGAYRVSLKDDALCIRKSCLVATWGAIIGALEKCLADADLPWESFKSYRNRGGPKLPGEKTSRRKPRK